MTGAKVNYTVKDDDSIEIELITSKDSISLISASVIKNSNDYTVEIITANQVTGSPDALTVPSGLESSNDSGAMLMVIDWYTKLNGTGAQTLVKRRDSSTVTKQ